MQPVSQAWGTPWGHISSKVDTAIRDDFQTIYIVCMRRQVHDSQDTQYTNGVVYVASTLDKARDWCKRNTDLELHDNERVWWYAICQEAIDGDYSGIHGLVEVVNWDGITIPYQPVEGYITKEPDNGDEVEQVSSQGNSGTGGGQTSDGQPGGNGSSDLAEGVKEQAVSAV